MKHENKIVEESYRTALYDMFTAMIRFLSVDDLDWLIPKIVAYAKATKQSRLR
mgnify:CR=1 FL=1